METKRKRNKTKFFLWILFFFSASAWTVFFVANLIQLILFWELFAGIVTIIAQISLLFFGFLILLIAFILIINYK